MLRCFVLVPLWFKYDRRREEEGEEECTKEEDDGVEDGGGVVGVEDTMVIEDVV